jgi:predicted transcriptional regulator
MTEPLTVSFVLPAELKALLEKWAQEDDRSLSYIVRRLITQEAARRAQGQPPKAPAKSK